jgi:transposase
VPIDSAQPKPTYEELERRVAEQDRRIASLEKQLADALKALEEAQRARKRQAAPFSKGKPKKDPKKPGRKAGDEYGEWARRGEPERIDEDIEVGLPAGCPKCGGRLDEIGVVEQFQTELPPIRPIHRRFRIHLGCCADCGCRVQPRDGRETSDAVLARAGEILEVAQRGAARFAHALIRVLKSALDLRDRRDELTGHGFAVLRGKVRAALDRVLAREPEYEPNARFVKHLRNEAPHLLTFLDHPEVEATNWLAEQAIRPAVITRKLSGGGNKTTRGAHVQEVLMSVLRTCVQQGRDALDLFVTAFRAPQPILLGLAPRPPTP